MGDIYFDYDRAAGFSIWLVDICLIYAALICISIMQFIIIVTWLAAFYVEVGFTITRMQNKIENTLFVDWKLWKNPQDQCSCTCALNISIADVKSLQRKIKNTVIEDCWNRNHGFLQLHYIEFHSEHIVWDHVITIHRIPR